MGELSPVTKLRRWLRGKQGSPTTSQPSAEQDPIEIALAALLGTAPLQEAQRLLVFVRYEQGEDLPECQANFLADLTRLGWAIWIVDNSPLPLAGPWLERIQAALYWQRPNQGLCIGAYGAAIELLHRVLGRQTNLKPPTLALVNNSFLPLLPASANPILFNLFTKPLPPGHFRGLTESREQAYHLQSYLLLLGPEAWHTQQAREFWLECAGLKEREALISQGEVALTGVLQQQGLRPEVMVPTSRLAAIASHRIGVQEHHPVSPIEHNPYLVYWRELLQLTGIIKKSALNNSSQSRTAGTSLVEFLEIAHQAGLAGAEAVIDRLVRY